MSFSIQDIFLHFKDDFINNYNLSFQQLKVFNHILSCRTPSLGGFVSTCQSCNTNTAFFHSCRDRHCPLCQGTNQVAWAENQMLSSLPIPYFHVVFTIPDSLHSLFFQNQKLCYDLLFKASSEAIVTLANSTKFLGFEPGFTSVLHTWGQTLQFHPHIHMIIPSGGLSKDGLRFVRSSSTFFLPTKVLSSVFRGIFLKYLKQHFSLPSDFINALYKKSFLVNIKEPFDHPTNVVKYLARYTHRVAISNSRIDNFDLATGLVTFSYKDNRDGGKQKQMTLHALEFMRRFFLHILPRKFMKIRHFGFLGNHNKFKRLALCRRLIGLSSTFLTSSSCQTQKKCRVCGKLLMIIHYPYSHYSSLMPRGA